MSNYISPEDFKEYIIKNNFVVTAAAITIGIASASFIKSFVGSVLMPSVYFVIGKIILQNVSTQLYKSVTDIFGDKASFNLDNFIKEALTWIFIVFGSYLIMDFVIRRWLLQPSTVSHGPALASQAPAARIMTSPAPQHPYMAATYM